jgi:hypothetical protein
VRSSCKQVQDHRKVETQEEEGMFFLPPGFLAVSTSAAVVRPGSPFGKALLDSAQRLGAEQLDRKRSDLNDAGLAHRSRLSVIDVLELKLPQMHQIVMNAPWR